MNRKKILIVVIVFLVIASLFVIKRLLFNTQNIKIYDIQNNNILLENSINEITENDVIVDNSQTAIDMQNENTIVNTVNEQNIITSNKNISTTVKNNEPKQEEKKAQQITKTETVEKKETTETIPNIKKEIKVESKNIIATETKPETIQQSQNAISNVIPKQTEKYVKNDNMINKIKQVIQNNESENMKKFGYNIVIDSSIKELTNQFTFYESRVINYLKYKSGTIRIYAEDCYKNGQFIMTQCYII